MEVYIDDMVAKTPTIGDHCGDLEEIFAQLRRRNMQLNPDKCAFTIKAGKFLGFMITKRGIDIRSPSTIKEVQSLVGKVTALSCFMSKAVDKVAPFFKCIKKSQIVLNGQRLVKRPSLR